MGGPVSESRFYMWRAIFAMAHADGVVTPEETEFLSEYMRSLAFTDQQKAILMDDMKHPQKIGDMYARITDSTDRSQFFYLSRMLVWSDGDYDAQEKKILQKLKKSHQSELDMEQVSQSVRESAQLVKPDLAGEHRDSFSLLESIRRFRDNFEK